MDRKLVGTGNTATIFIIRLLLLFLSTTSNIGARSKVVVVAHVERGVGNVKPSLSRGICKGGVLLQGRLFGFYG